MYYVFWRGSTWKPTLATSKDGVHWSESQILVDDLANQGRRVRPYCKYVSDGKGAIHMIFTNGHPRKEETNSVYYLKYEEGRFFKADGTVIGSIEKLPVQHRESDLVYNGKETGVRAWIWDLALDEAGHPVILYTRLPAEEDHRYHYARWDGTQWIDSEMTAGGKWFPQTREGAKEREPHYSGGMSLNHHDTSVVYLSRQVEGGTFEIEKWTTADHGKSWDSTAITRGSNPGMVNVRPIVPRGYTGLSDHILWMNGTYVHYDNYATGIRMLLPEPRP
jgi:hypothetical protein